MRFPLLAAWLFFQASTLWATFDDLPDLLQRRVEIYDDPRAFRLELESTLNQVDPAKDPEFWTALHTFAAEAAWFQEQSDLAQTHVDAALPRARELGFLKYEALLTYVQGGIFEYDAQADLWDISSKLIPEARQRLAARYQKPTQFMVKDSFAGWDKVDTRAVHDMLLHAITNSIDHGFLLPHARGERLHEAPALTLEAMQNDGQLVITLRDNGFGINWKKLEDLARDRNFKPAPGRELTDLLFQEGTSTAGQISTTSGRGMGLAAILAIAKKFGGDVSLHNNEQGRGACLRMTLPAPAVAIPAA